MNGIRDIIMILAAWLVQISVLTPDPAKIKSTMFNKHNTHTMNIFIQKCIFSQYHIPIITLNELNFYKCCCYIEHKFYNLKTKSDFGNLQSNLKLHKQNR